MAGPLRLFPRRDGLAEQDIVEISQGFDDGTWRPGESMTRRQFVRMAVRQFGIPEASSDMLTFDDVSRGDLAFEAIEGAVAAGLIHEAAGRLFAPDDARANTGASTTTCRSPGRPVEFPAPRAKARQNGH